MGYFRLQGFVLEPDYLNDTPDIPTRILNHTPDMPTLTPTPTPTPNWLPGLLLKPRCQCIMTLGLPV